MSDSVRHAHSVLPQCFELCMPIWICGREHATVPSAHNFARMEGEARHVAARLSDLLKSPIPLDLAADRACRIFNDEQFMSSCHRNNRREIAWHTHLMDAQNRSCASSEDSFNLSGIEIERVRVNVDKYGGRPAIKHRVNSSDIRMTDGDDFVSGLHSDRDQG